MKKLLLSLFTFIFISFNASAQDLPVFDFGVKAGVNTAWIGGLPDGIENDGSRFGFVGGVFTRINIPNSGIFIQPELVFSQSGGKIQSSLLGLVTEGEVNISALDIPILVGKRFDLAAVGLRVGAGPVFSPVLDVQDANGNEIPDASDFLIGLQVGAGVDISRFNIDLRFQTGFTDIENSDAFDFGKPQTVQLTLGYTFL